MNKSLKTIVYTLLTLVIISCGISISNNSIYKDGEWANAQWLGQDVVTLFIAAPMLFISYVQSIEKHHWKWNMVLAGILFYFVYTYAFFTIVAELTFLYLFHLPIFGFSLIGLFSTLSHLLHADTTIEIRSSPLKFWIIAFLLAVSLMLSILWLTEIISHLTIANYQSDTPDGEPTLIIYTLDLALVVPLMLIAVVGFWKNKQYGLKLTGVMLTKSATIGFALMGMSVSMFVQKISLGTFLIFLWFFIGLIGTVATALYINGISKGHRNS